jgi:outer membrane receptor protein involved in Fe transport
LGQLSLELGHQGLDSSAEYQVNSLLTHRSRVSLFNQWLCLTWERKFQEKLELRAYVGVSRGKPQQDSLLFLTGSTASAYRPEYGYRAVNGLAEVGYDFGPALKLQLGADSEVEEEDVLYFTQILYRADGQRQPLDELALIDPGEARSHTLVQVGPYLQAHSAPLPELPDFRLTGAIRGDFARFGPVEYPIQTSYRAAVAYRFGPALTLKLIGGHAFQLPSGTLLFAHGGFGNNQNIVGTERLDNPKPLNPQVVDSVELVAASQLGGVLSLEGSVYYQSLDDVIRFNRVASIVVARNSGREVTAGGELMARLRLGWFRPYLAASTSTRLSIQITSDLAGVTNVEGPPSLYPRFFGYAGADVELLPATLFGNAELRWAGARGASQAHYYLNDSEGYTLPGYQALDLTLSTGALPLLEPECGTRLLVSVRNLLGADWFEPGYGGADIPQLGRTLLIQLRQTL